MKLDTVKEAIHLFMRHLVSAARTTIMLLKDILAKFFVTKAGHLEYSFLRDTINMTAYLALNLDLWDVSCLHFFIRANFP